MNHQPESRPKHEIEHAPTVVHDYGADDTMLARWLWNAMSKGPRFWLMAIGTLALAVAVLLLVNALSAGDSAKSAAWDALDLARNSEDPEKLAENLEKVAESFPKSPAATWARLQAAGALFNEGVAKLATSPTTARPLLKKALDEFQEVADAAPKNSPPARLAALGVARTLEARNELKDAIEQYRRVASTWPGTDEAKFSTRQAEALTKPENVEFYKQLAAYKPPEKTIPPGGTGIFDGLVPPGHPPIDLPPLKMPAPAPGSDSNSNSTGPIRVPDRSLSEPLPLIAPEPAPTPKDAPAGGPKPGEIPGDPFKLPE